jgi:hypothetical protein
MPAALFLVICVSAMELQILANRIKEPVNQVLKLLTQIAQYMRFEVLMAVKMLMLVFWVVMPYGLVGTYQYFGGTYCLLQVYMALQPKRPTLTNLTRCVTLHTHLRSQIAASF